MQSLEAQLSKYQQAHQKTSTKLTHFIGIPAIFIACIMFLNWFTLTLFSYWAISFAWIALIALLIYYFLLNIRVGIVATVILFILTFIGTLIARPAPTLASVIIFLVLFIGGWILQFIGHAFEKNKPAFMQNLGQMLIAPLFVIIELFEMLGWDAFFGFKKRSEK